MGFNINQARQSGFTIVELLIVVVVIAILAAITIVSYNGITNQANTSAAQSTASTIIKKAELRANSSVGNYPVASTALTTLAGGSSNDSWNLPTGSATQVEAPATISAANVLTAITGAANTSPKHVVITPCPAAATTEAATTGLAVWYRDYTEGVAKRLTTGTGCPAI